MMDFEKSYSQLVRISTWKERFDYLYIGQTPFEETFGLVRGINQAFYQSLEWREIRSRVIARDLGCDLGLHGYEVSGRIVVHHINPLSPTDIIARHEKCFDVENLITTSHRTHREIHFGVSKFDVSWSPRRPGDTVLWKWNERSLSLC